MISSPQTYAEWVSVLNALKEKTDDLAVLHSRLSIGERHDEWEKIKRGV